MEGEVVTGGVDFCSALFSSARRSVSAGDVATLAASTTCLPLLALRPAQQQLSLQQTTVFSLLLVE